VDLGQIDSVGAPAVLSALTAHHVLERVDYPQKSFQFEHQQLQEYYAALDVRLRLLDMREGDHDESSSFTADYLNAPAWAEPLRMIAQTLAEESGNIEIDKQSRRGGKRLVAMTLSVDPVFAGELARLCGASIWNEVRSLFGERCRALYAISDTNYQQYALAAMLATGTGDFSDIIAPLLSGPDRQARLSVYRLWPDIRVESLGSNWRELVRAWSVEARVDFVSELLHQRVDDEIATFAADDDSSEVKKAAIDVLMWTGSDEALIRVLRSVDKHTFEELTRRNAEHFPEALRPEAIASMRAFVANTTDHSARLRTALSLIELGEPDLEDVIKDALASLPASDIHKLGSHYLEPALTILRKSDPAWGSSWLVPQIAEGLLYGPEHWLPLAPSIPVDLVATCLQRLETEDFKHRPIGGMTEVIAAGADTHLAARVFAKIRELRNKSLKQDGVRHESEWRIIEQLETVIRHLPHDVAVTGILSSVTDRDTLDVSLATDLLSKVARADAEPLDISDADLKLRLRAYLTSNVDLVLQQDDFDGGEKANLASSIAQVGEPEDMELLVRLIHADIERVRRGRAARAAGDRGPAGNGATMNYAGWHIRAVVHLDVAGAEQVLIDLLPEPEYASDVAAAMAREFLPKTDQRFERILRYDLMWAAREGRTLPSRDERQRCRFAVALNAEIRRLREQSQHSGSAPTSTVLARALAAIDGRASAAQVLEVIVEPGKWDQYTVLDAAEMLLMAGVVLPAATASALVDSVLERIAISMQESDKYLLLRSLALCPFVDDPAAGMVKIRNALSKRRLWENDLRLLVTAIGESRSEAAVDLLYDLASDKQTFEQCTGAFINAFAKLDTLRAREALLGIVDPGIVGIALTRRPYREEVVVARIAELAERSSEVERRLRELCEQDLPELNRHILSKVVARLESLEALTANLHLIDDAKPSPVPQGVWEQLESAFVEQRPYGLNSNVIAIHARTSNELRARLFRMAHEDPKRRESAFMLLGQIEAWRLEYGRPTDEPRHPDLASGKVWPLMEHNYRTQCTTRSYRENAGETMPLDKSRENGSLA
jgi:hypothetical protein